MSIQYPTFQSDPTLNSLTASIGLSATLGTFNQISASFVSASNYIGISAGETNIFVGDKTISGSLIVSSSLTASNISSSANVSIGGNITFSNAGGIVFGTTAGGSGTPSSQTLSDYEQGSWSPAFSASAVSSFTASIGAASTFGRYTKIGNVVFVDGCVTLTSTGSSSGNIRIGNLPFAASSTAAYSINGGFFGLPSAFNSSVSGTVIGKTVQSQTYFNLYKLSSGGVLLMTVTDLTNTSIYSFYGSYMVN